MNIDDNDLNGRCFIYAAKTFEVMLGIKFSIQANEYHFKMRLKRWN